MNKKIRLIVLGVLITANLNYAFTGGDGTAGNPYQISTKADLEAVNTNLAASYILLNDIDLTGTTYTRAVIAPNLLTGDNFTGTAFSGVFDGDGFTITALSISSSTITHIGLFGKIETGGLVRNLGMLNCNINALSNLGALVGYNLGSIEGCYAIGAVNGTFRVGGLCGYNLGSISNSFTEGTVSGSGNIGGLCGYNYHSTVLSSYSLCSVSGSSSTTIGGFCGQNYYGTIQNCFSTGSSIGYIRAGGFCGVNYHGTINNSYSIGQASAQYTVGGFCAENSSGTISGCFWNTETSGLAASSGGTGKSTGQLKLLSTFTGAGWTFSSNEGWAMSNPDNSFRGYPILYWQEDIEPLPSYTVVFNIGENGFITSGDLTQSVFDGHSATAPAVVANTGWTFMKWDKSFTNVTSDMIITAIYLKGAGTVASPFYITSKADIEAVNVKLFAHYVLMNDIDMSGTIYNAAVIAPDTSTNWGYQGIPFSGSFDGAGFKITGLTIEPTNSYIGLFGQINAGGVVHSLSIEDCQVGSFDSWYYVGSLCGYNYGTIRNCSSSGSVSGYDSVGNLCGYNDGIIQSCNSTGSVNGTNYAGGLCGYNYGGAILDSYSSAAVSGTWEIGGLSGKNRNSSISRCYSTGPVSGSSSVGGLCGENYEGSTISDSYSISEVNGGWYVGGLCGRNSSSAISNCYSSGPVTAQSTTVGGLCSENFGSVSVTDCFWDLQTSGQSSSAGGTGKTTAEMKDVAAYRNAGWLIADFDKGFPGWYLEQDGYPMLDYQKPSTVIVPNVAGLNISQAQSLLADSGLTGNVVYVNSWYVPAGEVIGLQANIGGYVYSNSQLDMCVSLGNSGDGSITNPYPIACARDLEKIKQKPSMNYILTADIYLSGKVYIYPIIDFFYGTFDGKGFAIKNLTIESGNCQLFLRIERSGKVMNLGLEYCNMSNSILTDSNLGTIKNCYAVGNITGNSNYTGGLVGRNEGDIINCYTSVKIKVPLGDFIGGLCGTNDFRGKIESCYSTGAVSGDDSIGGLCGRNSSDGKIESCYSTGAVSGDGYIGGLCGANEMGNIKNCYALGSVTARERVGGLCGLNRGAIESCYSANLVVGSYYVGGLCGENYNGSVLNSFWDTQVSERTTSAGGTGKTTVQMQTGSTFADAGWDFVNEETNGLMDLWYMPQGGYPMLWWQAAKGDFNYDGGIDLLDLGVITAQWLDQSTESYRPACDANGDGVVDFLDYAMLALEWL